VVKEGFKYILFIFVLVKFRLLTFTFKLNIVWLNFFKNFSKILKKKQKTFDILKSCFIIIRVNRAYGYTIGALDFIAIDHFTAWYVIDSHIELPPFVGAETCPPIRDNNATDPEWRDFVASQVTGRLAPTFPQEKEDEEPPGKLLATICCC